MLDLYNNIKARRKELNLSQQELAELVGYSGKSMISKIERGEVDLGETMLRKIAHALQTTPGDLLGSDYTYISSQNSNEFQKRIFSGNLKYYLYKSGNTQKEVSEIIGISTTSMNDYINGKTLPRPEIIQRLASYFGISDYDLLDDTEKKDPVNSLYVKFEQLSQTDKLNLYVKMNSIDYTSSLVGSDEDFIINVYKNLPEHHKKLLFEYAKMLCNLMIEDQNEVNKNENK